MIRIYKKLENIIFY